MDPPPPPPSLSATAAATTTTPNHPYPDSLDSSPRSRTTDSWDDPIPPSAVATKLRLMCSYGGHIVPRPHDKSLCYVGGDTRIIVIDRQSSLSDLHHRLSKSLHHHHSPFLLKYQLPNEDLDSLISLTTDEDFDNMLEEYDRTTSSSAKPSRLRLFVFPLKPESSQSIDIGQMLDSSTKSSSEDWFLNALNGAGLLSRGFSDSASVNCLLGLDDGAVLNNLESGTRDTEVAQAGSFGNIKNVKQGQDVHSVPDSPMLDTSSSFGSTSSSPSLANLPPIRVHVDDQKVVGIEEQFAQMSVGVGGGGGQKQEEVFVALSSPPPMPATIAVSAVPLSSAAISGEYPNRVVSDDERSDHGLPVGYRKPLPPQPQSVLQTLPQQSKSSGGGLELPSPDSVSSDGSLSNAINRPKPMLYQETVVQIPSGNSRIPVNAVDPKVNLSDPSTRVQMQQQVQDSGYVLQPQFEQQQQQQQFIHPGTHYIHHHPTGAVPMSAYYPLYPPQQQHHHHHPQLDQQYPVYYMPPRQAQAYNLSVHQSNLNETATGIPSSRPQTPPPNPIMVSPAAYNPIRNAPIAKPEMAGGVYRTATTGAPQLVQVPSSQHQQQYLGFSQMHHPSQSVAPTSAVTANYGYEFADPSHAQIYYTQPLAPTLASQYQTMTAATAVGLPEASAQLPTDNIKQQIRTSQAL